MWMGWLVHHEFRRNVVSAAAAEIGKGDEHSESCALLSIRINTSRVVYYWNRWLGFRPAWLESSEQSMWGGSAPVTFQNL